jgi:Tol biopolymer transport system component
VTTDIHVYLIPSGTLTRVTTEGSTNDRPEWTPDGKRLLFRSERGDDIGLWSQSTDFTGAAEPLMLNGRGDVWEGIISPDGRTLLYRSGTLGGANILYRSLQGDTTPKPVAATPFTEWGARFSPDGRWVVYSSDDSRVMQVYVRPFPGPGARVQVSVDGGANALWSRNGRKIYYLSNQQVFTASVTTTPTFAVTSTKVLFTTDFLDQPGHAPYDVSPDGKYLLMLKPSISGDQVVVAHNWRAELQERVRASRATR